MLNLFTKPIKSDVNLIARHALVLLLATKNKLLAGIYARYNDYLPGALIMRCISFSRLVTQTIPSLIALAFSAHVMAAQVPPDVQLAEEQVLVRGNGAEPASIDPQKIEGTPGGAVVRDLFEGLVVQDSKGNTIPGQAESWTVSDDNKVFTFKIRDTAKWSDGNPVTADDFVYGFRRAVDPKTASNYGWYMEIPTIINAGAILKGEKPVESLGVKAIDDKTFQVTLEQPVPYFIKMLAHYTTFPAPQKVIEQYGDDWTKPGNIVSNGAYKLKDWKINEKIVLERNKNYWNDKETVINEVAFLPISSGNAELNRYKAGEVDITNIIPLEHYRSLKKEIPDEIITTPMLGTYYYAFNTKRAPFDNADVRKALSYAINREAITQYILGQGQKPAYAFTPEAVNGFTPPASQYGQMTHKERLDKARQILSKAGYSKSNPLKITLLYNTSESHKKVAIAVAQMWKDIGVQTTLENQEWKTFLDTKNAGNFDVARAGWVGDYNEASTMLDLNTSDHGSNSGKYSNKEYDELMDRSRTVSSDEERAQLYKDAEELLAEDMPVAPVYQYVNSRLVKPYLGGFPMENVENNVYTRELYMIKEK